MSKTLRVFFILVFCTIVATIISLPQQFVIHGTTFRRPNLTLNIFGKQILNDLNLKQGLDIQGGIQVVLRADMSKINNSDQAAALESVKEVIQRRVDLYGVSEPVVQTSQAGSESRIIVELPGVRDEAQALQLIGATAQLDFRIQNSTPSATASQSAVALFADFRETGLTGKQLSRSSVQFNQSGEPVIALEFNGEGRDLFGTITKNNVGKIMAIFLDNSPIMFPQISTPILDGQAIISGNFTVDEAKQLSIQLNAGALPVPIEVIQQQTIGATLGQDSVQRSMQAGLIGIVLVAVFMIANYGAKGVLADLSLFSYAVFTIAIYKLFGVTLTLPGLAGLILSVGMAVDSNILVFERMKEELRSGKAFMPALELGFTRAWNSIKDANLTTIMIALVLINPIDLDILNRSGLVKGFGLTLLIGVLVSLFTSMVVTRTLMKLFLKGDK